MNPWESATEVPFSTSRYEKRLLVFIDVLGFSDFVMSNSEEGKELVVKTLADGFQKDVNEGAKYIASGGGQSFRPAFNFFSDTIIFSMPLDLFSFQRGLPSIDINKYSLLHSAATYISKIQLFSLKQGLLTRGCLTIGDMYHNQNTWFGPALIEAHYYESKIAIYPRVVLTDAARTYFGDEIFNVQTPLVLKDSDGIFFVEYLNFIHSELNDDFIEAHHLLRKIIADNMDFLGSKKRAYQLQKWRWLAGYFNRFSSEELRAAHSGKLAPMIDV